MCTAVAVRTRCVARCGQRLMLVAPIGGPGFWCCCQPAFDFHHPRCHAVTLPRCPCCYSATLPRCCAATLHTLLLCYSATRPQCFTTTRCYSAALPQCHNATLPHAAALLQSVTAGSCAPCCSRRKCGWATCGCLMSCAGTGGASRCSTYGQRASWGRRRSRQST